MPIASDILPGQKTPAQLMREEQQDGGNVVPIKKATPTPAQLMRQEAEIARKVQTFNNSKIDPQRQADAARISAERNIPIEAAYHDIENLRAEKKFQDAQEAARDYPATQKTLADRIWGPITQGDVLDLTTPERVFRSLADTWVHRPKLSEASQLAQKDMYGTLTNAERTRLEELKAEQRKRVDLQLSFLGQAPSTILDSTMMMASHIWRAGKDGVITDKYLPDAVGMATAAFRIPELMASYILESGKDAAGMSYNDLDGVLDAEGKPLTKEEKTAIATTVGALTAVIEIIPLEKGMKTIPGFEKMTGRAGGQWLAKMVGKNPTSRALAGRLGALLSTATAESFTEVAEEATQIIGEIAAGGETKDGENIMSGAPRRLVHGAIAAFLAGGGFALPGTAIGSAMDIGKAHKNRALLEEIGENIANGKLNKVSPEALTAHILNIKEQPGVPQEVSASSEAVIALFQAEGFDPKQIEQQFPEMAKALDKADETGAEVAIPLEHFAKLTSLKGYKNFINDVRASPKDMTLNEAKVADEELSATVAQALAENRPHATPMRGAIFDKAKAQLIGAGQAEEVAHNQALLLSAIITTRAERSGIAPEEYAKRHGIEISSTVVQAIKMGSHIDAIRSGEEVVTPPEEGVLKPLFQAVMGEPKNGLYSLGLDAEGVKALRKAGVKVYNNGNITVKEAERVIAKAKLPPDVSTEAVRSSIAAAGITHEELQTMSNEDVVTRIAERSLEQSTDTKSPAFLKWFGDSKVVDENGEPLVVYHGTGDDIAEFRIGKRGVLGAGIYFTTDPEVAEEFASWKEAGDNIMPVYLAINNPYVHKHNRVAGVDPGVAILRDLLGARKTQPLEERMERTGNDTLGPELQKELKARGYDGIIVEYERGVAYEGTKEIVAFSPTQIKSIFNRGTYDPNNPNILFQSGMPLLGQQLPTEGNKRTVKAIAQAMTDDHMQKHGRQLFPEKEQADYDQVLNDVAREVDAQLPQPNSGVGWYSQDVATAIDLASKVFPTLKTDVAHRQLFLTFAGIFSNGNTPQNAFALSAEAFEAFLVDLKVPISRAEAAEIRNENLGQSEETAAKWSVRNALNEQHLGLINLIIEREGGLEAGMNWLLTPQPREAINATMQAFGWKEKRYKSKKDVAGPPAYGAMVFGPKLGRYTMGLQGVEIDADNVTIDQWFIRTYRRLTGRLMELPLGAEGIVGQPTEVDRTTIFRLMGDLVKATKMAANDLQAVLWFFEKRLWRSQGLNTDEGTNSDGARQLLQSKGIPVDDGAGGDAAGVAARPGAERAKPRDNRSIDTGTGSRGGEARQKEVLGKIPRLAGLPPQSLGPNSKVVAAAKKYLAERGLPHRRQASHVQVDPKRGKRLAEAYEAMKHEPNDPLVAAAYAAMAEEVKAQYQAVLDMGLEIERITGDNPYAEGPRQAIEDLARGHLWFFPSTDGFGSINVITDNPLLEPTEFKVGDYVMTVNDLFRVVHDVFGHGLEGSGFGPHGEENAWQAHVRMFSPLAAWAMTSETRGQNSWVNYGPYGEANQADQKNTVFADQKTGLLPRWALLEGVVDDAPTVLYQQGDVFYSGLRRAVGGINMGKAPAAQWIATIKNIQGVKQEELKWLELEEWLGQQKGSVTKEALLEYLAANEVKVEEVVKGEIDESVVEAWWTDEGGADSQTPYAELTPEEQLAAINIYRDQVARYEEGGTKFSQYQLPGGENYRELLLTLPTRAATAPVEVHASFANGRWGVFDAGGGVVEDGFPTAEAARSRVAIINAGAGAISEGQKSREVFASPHFDEPNILAHVRFNERTVDLPANEKEQAAEAEYQKAQRRLTEIDDRIRTLTTVRQDEIGDIEMAKRKELQASGMSAGQIAREIGNMIFEETKITKEMLRLDQERNAIMMLAPPKRRQQRILFIEEIQSDWHQKGRKGGYNNEENVKKQFREWAIAKRHTSERMADMFMDQHYGPHDSYFSEFKTTQKIRTDGVPDAPFKTTWPELAMKRMIRWAAENGFDKIAWTPGDVQAERYDLSKQVERVLYFDEQKRLDIDVKGGETVVRENIEPKDIPDIIGKEAADKLINNPSRKGDDETDGRFAALEGLDLKVGGEGMRAFYDKMLVDVANKLGKKFGAKVGKATLGPPLDPDMTFESDAERRDFQNATGRHDAHSMDITPAMRDSVMQGQALFQGPRGFITFSKLRDFFKITLTGRANLSTFLHESGHLALELLQDAVARGEASESDIADLAALKNWMGLAPDAPIGPDQHEQFARGFEAYLMEGKAPSLELQGAFDRFKAWLLSIYKKITGLGVTLDDDIRGVMDRLVASDKAITEAKAQLGFLIKPEPQESLHLTDEEYQRYVDAWTRARDKAQQIADGKAVAEAMRERKAAWKKERDAVKEELAKTLHATPGYMAWKELEEGEAKIDPTSVPADMATYAKGLTGDPGLPLDLVGEMFGFESGQAMLEAITLAKVTDQSLDAQAKQIMHERHGVMDAARISKEALDAVHHDGATEVMLTEFRAMAENAGIKVRPGIAQFLRMKAQQEVAGLTKRQLDPTIWRRAELKAAQASAVHASKGRMGEAALAKRQQMMAAAMFRATSEALDRIEAIHDFLGDFTTKKRRATLGKAGELYLDGVDELLEGIEFKQVSAKELAKRKTLQEVIDHAAAEGEQLNIPDSVLANLNKKNYSTMTLEELEAVHDAVANLWTLAKLKNTLRAGKEKRELNEALDEMAATAERALGTRKVRDMLNPSAITKAINKIRWARAKLVKMEFLFGWLDGQPDGGLMHRLIYQPIADARKAEFDLLKKLNAAILDRMRAMPAEQKVRWETSRKFMGQTVRGHNIIAAALNIGNESNKQKLLEGYGWNEIQFRAELDAFMTKADWDMVQHIWTEINTLWPMIEGTAFKATGLRPPKVVPSPVDTPFGQYAGGYYPVVYDPNQNEDVNKRQQASAGSNGLFANNFLSPKLNSGFTKERVKYSAPILLSLDVLSQHLIEVVHYVTHYEALTQADKITRHPKFKALVIKTMGKEFHREIRPYLQDIANNVSQRRVNEFGEPVLRYLRTGVSLTALGYNLITGLKQLLGVTTALDAIGPKYWAAGIAKSWLSPTAAKNWREARAKSKELNQLINDFDRDIKAVNDTYARKWGGGLKENAIRYAFTHIGYMQLMVNVATWHGAYDQAIADNKTEEQAINHADSVVRKTQSSGGIKDLADVQRSGETTKMLTMFYSFFSVLYNRLEDIQKQTKSIRDVPRAMRRISILIIMPSILNVAGQELYAAMFGDDEDDEDKHSFPVRVALESYSYTLGSIPLLRSVGSLEYRPQLSPVVGAFDKIVRASASLIKWGWEGEPPTEKQAANIADAAGTITKTPGSAIWRLAMDVFGEDEDE